MLTAISKIPKQTRYYEERQDVAEDDLQVDYILSRILVEHLKSLFPESFFVVRLRTRVHLSCTRVLPRADNLTLNRICLSI